MRHAWFLLLIGCSQEDVLVARQLPAAEKADAAQVVAGNNQFAIDVYGQMPTGNAIFSPFSISTAFAMVDAGAAGTTDSELRTAFHFTLPGDQMHAAYGALLTSLDTGRGYGTYTLATADGLFPQVGLALQPAFASTLQHDYRADPDPVDFQDAEAARAHINGWVSDQTDGKIPQLFNEGDISVRTNLALANAILFKGTWDRQFDPSKTSPGPFHVSGGATVQTPMMNGSVSIAYAQLASGRVGVLPFKGKDLAMLVMVPDDPDGLAAFEAQLTPDAIATAVAAAGEPQPLEMSMPKFAITTSLPLGGILHTLGVTSLFVPGEADLSGIDGARDLYVQTSVHAAMITVDEEGAEAAAATGVGIGPSGMPSPFVVDHSFAFAIYDNVTGSILFMGRCADPTK